MKHIGGTNEHDAYSKGLTQRFNKKKRAESAESSCYITGKKVTENPTVVAMSS